MTGLPRTDSGCSMSVMSVVLGRVVPALLMLMLGGTRVAAQSRFAPAATNPRDTRGSGACTIAASIAGAGTGMVLGGIIGHHIERALDDSEDAGVTGLALGMIVGAFGGMRLAPQALRQSAG